MQPVTQDAQPPTGVIIVDKPAGLTSFEVVRSVRRAYQVKRVGHTGTLDPFATGVLAVCVGRAATRLVPWLQRGDKEYEAEITAKDLCRKHGMSDATLYKWKAKFSNLEVNEARRLRDLEDENRKLKRLVADLSLDKMALEEVLKKL